MTPKQWASKRKALLSIRSDIDRYNAEYKRLAPRYGEIPVGSVFVDPFLYADAGMEFMRLLRIGMAPIDAFNEAVAYSAESVRKWNAKSEWQQHRNPTFAESKLLDWLHRINQAIIIDGKLV